MLQVTFNGLCTTGQSFAVNFHAKGLCVSDVFSWFPDGHINMCCYDDRMTGSVACCAVECNLAHVSNDEVKPSTWDCFIHLPQLVPIASVEARKIRCAMKQSTRYPPRQRTCRMPLARMVGISPRATPSPRMGTVDLLTLSFRFRLQLRYSSG